jgi:hypothetical protein
LSGGRGRVRVEEIGRRVEGEGSRAGGLISTDEGQHGRRGNGPNAEWGGTESLTSGARLVARMGRRRGAHGAWADPGRNKVGRAQMNSNVWDLFKSISN